MSKPQRRQRSTLAEVARAAGVSVATASRALNGDNAALRANTAARAEKIRQLAQKLGYSPDLRARSLRGGQSNSIGVVYSEVHPMMDETSYAPMFRAFGEVLEAAGYNLMFVHVPRAAGVLPASMLHAVDAAVYYHRITEGQVDAARLVRGPSILINCEAKLPYPRVIPDDVSGAVELTRHLLDLGHRRIVYLNRGRPGADFVHYSAALRRDVMRQTMTAAGLGSGYEVWEGDIAAPFQELTARYMSLPPAERPTVIVANYSLIAISMLNEFLRQGVKVPEQLSICTFDDHDLVAHAMVPLTTVAVPMPEIGRTAAGLILGLLQKLHQGIAKEIILPERLMVRRSTGPAPQQR
ncbi:MAG TPA: LacI family DNA-binding transcriptional regulator [Tepidisphaeraceae bacterium]|nr:LacI family DNA-binding transcriptional regulator [Tepidisphaeraceae bacterium]